MRALLPWILPALMVFLGLILPLHAQTPPPPASSSHPGKTVVEGANCNLCHSIPEVAAPTRMASCVSCHEWVKTTSANPTARAKAMSLFPLWERYEKSIQSYASVPHLGTAMARLDPAWVARYLSDPYDLRPGMPEMMVRVGLSKTDIQSIADWFGTYQAHAATTPAPSSANLEAGKQLFEQRGCVACHTFGATTTTPGIPAAPDLRHARDRMTDDMIVAWIENPAAISPETTMPALGLTHEEAIRVRDYLVLASPGGKKPSTLPNNLPTVDRPVKWAEVEERVLGKICVHCHMDPSQNDGRAGPGNAGGFGWPATGIELQTREGVAEHADAVLEAMLRRRDEARRDVVAPGEAPQSIQRPKKPGMPLGLPPIPDEDIALVAAWISQGCPE